MMRSRLSLWTVVAAVVVVAAAGCKQDVNACLDCSITTIAVFDPSGGLIPLPNDLAKAQTGKLPTTKDVMAADGTTKAMATFPPPMKEFVENYLNSAPGFPVEMPLSVKFSKDDVDPATLGGDTILLYDVTEVAAALKLVDADQKAAALKVAMISRVQGLVATPPVETISYSEDLYLMPPVTTWDTSVTTARPLDPGRTYYAVVTTGVKNVAGAPVAAAQVYSYLQSRKPLVDDKGAATVFVSDNQTQADQLAAQLELIRLSLAPYLDYFEASATDAIQRKDIVVSWTFSTWSAQAVLDATSGVIPLPNNLVRTAPDGPIAIPTSDAMPAAFKSFVEDYLNKLDGFPQLMPVSLPFNSGTVDVATLAGQAVRVYDVTALLAEMAKETPDMASVPVTEVTGLTFGNSLLQYSASSGLPVSQASVRPPAPWAPGHTFLAVATSAIHGADGAAVGSPFVFGFAKVSVPLVMEDGTPLIPASFEEAAQLEAIRAGLAPLLGWLETLPAGQGVSKADVVLAWTFTSSAGNEALFDPTTGILPFPNDLLIDQATGKVALPLSPSDPDAVKALKAGLNTLDGFSTNGPATTMFSLPLDPATLTLVPDLFGLTPDVVTGAPAYGIGMADLTAVDPSNPDTLPNLIVYGSDKVTARFDQGQLTIQNISGQPLPPNSRFMVMIFSTLKSEGAGALPIHVSPVFWLARNELPLVDDQGRSQLPSSLSDAEAAQLEQLRQAYKPIFDAIQGTADYEPLLGSINRDKVNGFFTFTTGTTTSDLVSLNQNMPPPAKGAGVLKLVASAGADWAGAPSDQIDRVCDGCTVNIHTVLAPPDLADPKNPIMGTFKVDASGAPVMVERVLPIEVVVPKGVGPFPVVLFQHGIHGTRKNVTMIANDLAGAGLATVAFDLPMHGDHPIRIDSSGAGFFTADVFSVRDNIREGALDQAQVIRFVRDATSSGLASQLDLASLLDTTKVYFLGVSLGSIVGTVGSGLVRDVSRVALVVPGGHMMRIFTETANVDFKKPLLDALAALGIQKDSPAYFQFLMLGQWALDRADPVNWAKSLVLEGDPTAQRFRIVEALGDDFIPNGATQALGMALGIPKDATPPAAYQSFAAQNKDGAPAICHSFFLDGCDGTQFPDQSKVDTAQADAKQFVIDFLKM